MHRLAAFQEINNHTVCSRVLIHACNPSDLLRRNLNDNLKYWFVWLFPSSVAVYSLISLCMLVLSVVGVNSEELIGLLEPMAALLFVPILLMISGGMAQDINK